jgi:hypothetical protein
MDRSNELSAPFRELQTNSRIQDILGTPRLWALPQPVRVKHGGFKDLGVTAPVPPNLKSNATTMAWRPDVSILSYPGNRRWLVVTGHMPDGRTPTGIFDSEPPHTRVDGGPVKGFFTLTNKGAVHMVSVDLPRGVVARMAEGVLASEPDSRILLRLLPRFCRGAVRWYQDDRCLQVWTAI